eukprot:4397311-Prymnesium_polylepis.1
MGWRAPCTISAIVPLTRALLDRCVGLHLNGVAFSHVARAVRLVPGTCESGCDGSRQTDWTVCGPICTAACVKRVCYDGSRVTRACPSFDCVAKDFIDAIFQPPPAVVRWPSGYIRGVERDTSAFSK